MITEELKRRRQKRWQLVQYLRIRNQKTNEIMGHLVDISKEGIMVISEHAIQPNTIYKFSMEIPQSQIERRIKSLRFDAKGLWTKPDINPFFHNSGFCLVNPKTETVDSIEHLIKELKQLNENLETVPV